MTTQIKGYPFKVPIDAELYFKCVAAPSPRCRGG